MENEGPMAAYRGFRDDEGPLSYYNVMRAMTLIGFVGSMIIGWSLTPWFPWK